MTVTMIVLACVALVVAIASLVYCFKVALVYHRFNEQVADWAKSLDDEMMLAIDSAARRLLVSLDSRISEQKEQQSEEEENNNQLNQEDNESIVLEA